MSAKKTRIMYIEDKSGGLNGPARIGRVTFSKSGQSIHYAGRTFQKLGGQGFKANYFDTDRGPFLDFETAQGWSRPAL